MTMSRLALALVAMSVAPVCAHSQELSELVTAGRFEDAASILAGAGPQEAEEGVNLIFAEAYQNGFQRRDFAYCIRGIAAAKTVPNVGVPQRELLDFWHGFAVFRLAAPLAEPQDLAAALRTLPMFQEALELIRASGTYPESIYLPPLGGPWNPLDVATLVRGLETFIEIQEAIIRRGY